MGSARLSRILEPQPYSMTGRKAFGMFLRFEGLSILVTVFDDNHPPMPVGIFDDDASKGCLVGHDAALARATGIALLNFLCAPLFVRVERGGDMKAANDKHSPAAWGFLPAGVAPRGFSREQSAEWIGVSPRSSTYL